MSIVYEPDNNELSPVERAAALVMDAIFDALSKPTLIDPDDDEVDW